jgi:pilus assembly protein CpaE
MTVPQISVGILARSPDIRDSLNRQVEATQLATVKVIVDDYPTIEDDHATQMFLEARPDIILVDMQDQKAAIKALFVLHAVLPETWLCASSTATEPQLIIETMQAGAREYLQKPVSARSLTLSFSRYLDEKQRHRTERIRGKLYCVTSAKGGSGATSVATNLAVTVAGMSESRVALIDLNSPVGDVAAYLNVKTQYSVADALTAAPRLDPLLLDTFMSKAHGISLLAGPKKFQAAPSAGAPGLAKLLRVISQTYTHSFIDVPSSFDPEHLQVVTDMSEAVLVVLTPELPALWRTHRLVLYLSGAGCADRLRLIVNRDSKRYELSEREITRILSHPIYWRLPNNYAAAIQAINSGKPIVSANNSSLTKSYQRLAHQLTGVSGGAQKRGFMSALFGGK